MREPYERAEREKARLKAEQDAVEAKRKVELFVAKGTLAYSEPLALEICERISSGELLINIAIDPHMPTVRRFDQWLNENVEFKGLYGASITDRLNIRKSSQFQTPQRAISRTWRATGELSGSSMARLSPGPGFVWRRG
jgi:hypothetical protein